MIAPCALYHVLFLVNVRGLLLLHFTTLLHPPLSPQGLPAEPQTMILGAVVKQDRATKETLSSFSVAYQKLVPTVRMNKFLFRTCSF